MDESNTSLAQIIKVIYNPLNLKISKFELEQESKAYKACLFELSGRHILCREAKITPKKKGQFVTFWKRNIEGVTTPFSMDDSFDFYVVNVRDQEQYGQFVFPKSVLLKHRVLSSENNPGKRAFRVYPDWVEPDNKQAKRAQEWQIDYFYRINSQTNLNKVSALYQLA
ncbi:MepB family protein [Formosa haliotis]|uniref:MepB family protein n=1 Tax=Formosa haliotis TaxID=1555194 RepID=UPI000826767A|nr:MepB family protein [Formosa haliotis]